MVSNEINLFMEAHPHNLMAVISDLSQQKRKLPTPVVENTIIKLIQAFADMASVGIDHKDIKHHNLLITKDWNIKIIDFSISTQAQSIETTTTATEVNPIQGTKGYIAPELEEIQAKASKKASIESKKLMSFPLE